MVRVNLNHWFIEDNCLKIALINMYASINIINDDNSILFRVNVIDSQSYIRELYFDFYSLEKAISFVENTISVCWNLDEVTIKYNEYCDKYGKVYKK